ncbi:hypothetical protein PHYBLDRAFT_62993 [Phycomyces blakesleeanus NRRL 1555(-)]|uniref:Uncharacterized protein n=1 Tax=Phycomyces blakesleeanus (strain ATCC 8743b / DSM 1359 / FGSC 10004 / NBRC 33097 / NRRL 1555) TaxID=763407 RepID=A0A163E5K4_PHYB8|nr:hypothetical protein PHYBLDRAFT_62993 [Phycomyces blakesleeanus NRRL 1555(-)]OAD76810.1 hypothetical protein PHYBLDRAFT_62993 [Phycomyces blakesleeanus NRRL 1555(-)]|eukprot:XP_018294850.1 hypothetical protein PHYBLDRAFT_62993 [Phycomyces blakesleeanus NRRL 1555(-)]
MYESSAFQDETVPHQQYNTLVQVYRTRRRQILSHFETRIECSLSVICDITVKKTQTRTRRAPLYSKMPRLVLQNNFGNRTYDLSSKTNFVPVISLSVELGQLILANCYKCVSLNLTSLVNCAGLFFYFIYSVSNFEFYFYFYFHITVCGTRCLALRGNLGSIEVKTMTNLACLGFSDQLWRFISISFTFISTNLPNHIKIHKVLCRKEKEEEEDFSCCLSIYLSPQILSSHLFFLFAILLLVPVALGRG